jgi:hypothetical protein
MFSLDGRGHPRLCRSESTLQIVGKGRVEHVDEEIVVDVFLDHRARASVHDLEGEAGAEADEGGEDGTAEESNHEGVAERAEAVVGG